jgi:Ca2+:H+ antiporter
MSTEFDTPAKKRKYYAENAEGMTGSFRAIAVARRLINKSRRKSETKEQEGGRSISAGSADSTIVNETTPIVSLPKPQSIRERGLGAEKEEVSVWKNFLEMWTGKPISLLLFFAPFGYASHVLGWGPQYVFWLNFLTMVPLASILGDFTEEAALHAGDVVGALLNASFGNAVEIVVTINLLMANEIRVVQSTLIGSIYSNMLLVLGMCFFFGGIFPVRDQKFNTRSAMAMMSLLALSSIALVLPTPFADYWEVEDATVLAVSRVSAIFLLLCYLQLLYFQFFHSEEEEDHDDDEEEEEEEIPIIPMNLALFGLASTTILVSIFSDYLVASLEGFCAQSGFSPTFVGLIILPVVGNAVEHMTAVSVAMKNKMDLAIGVAFGSSTQMALLVAPFAVLLGWYADKPMTLNFPQYEIALYILSMFTISMCIGTGKSNWLLGSVLIFTYCMLAIGFWFEKVEDYQISDAPAN